MLSARSFALSPHSFSLGPFDPLPPPPPLSNANSRLVQRNLLGLDSSLELPSILAGKHGTKRLSPLQAAITDNTDKLTPKFELKKKLESDKMEAMTLNQINDHWKYYESLVFFVLPFIRT